MEKDLCRGLYTSLFCVIIPTLFPYFLRFWYPYILLHFKCFLLLVTYRLAVAQAKLVPINAHATWQPRSVDREQWRPKGRQTLLQHSQLSQRGEFWHVSVSERQRSRPRGQNLRVPFLRTVLPPEVGENARAMAATARQKRLYLHHQDEFQHNYYVVVSLQHSDHGGVVRIFVGRSEVVKRLLITLFTLFTRHNFSYTRSVICGVLTSMC